MKNKFFRWAALLCAIVLTAFNNYQKLNGDLEMTYFHYTGSVYSDTYYDNPMNWYIGDVICGPPGTKLCKLYANPLPWPDENFPDFSGLSSGEHVRTTTNSNVVTNRAFKQ